MSIYVSFETHTKIRDEWITPPYWWAKFCVEESANNIYFNFKFVIICKNNNFKCRYVTKVTEKRKNMASKQ